MPTRTGFSRYHVVGPPARGFWRATTHHEPFDPPPAPPPIREVDPRDDDSGRWDAPAGEYRVLYCATEPEGALGEKLAPFMPNVSAVQRIEEFLEEEPDPEFADDYLEASLDAAVALFPRAASLLKEFGLHVLDIRTLADERRPFTRRLGALIRKVATTQAGELRVSGLRYDSRLPPRWECWALWEPLPLDAHQAEVQRVDIDTPALRTAAQLLGVVLRG